MGFKGEAIFMDCDVLCLGDIAEILREPERFSAGEIVGNHKLWYGDHPYGRMTSAVSAVQHDYIPSTKTKFLGQEQSAYPRKNWSSVMLFNCAHEDCKKLTPEFVNTATGLHLHRFQWTDSVGSLSPQWNYLVGEGQEVKDPKLIHYTIGGPWFNEYSDCEYSNEWFDELAKMQDGVSDVWGHSFSSAETQGHPNSQSVPGRTESGGILPPRVNGV